MQVAYFHIYIVELVLECDASKTPGLKLAIATWKQIILLPLEITPECNLPDPWWGSLFSVTNDRLI